jgi:hypothetical protein
LFPRSLRLAACSNPRASPDYSALRRLLLSQYANSESVERNRRVSGEGLQPKASSLHSRLPASGGVRRPDPSGRWSAGMKSTVRFLRHDGICRPMCCCLKSLDRSTAFRLGSAQTGKDAPEVLRPTHRRDEFRSAIPQRVARQQSPSPLHRHAHPKTVPGSATMNLQRTVNSVLTVCLTPRGPPQEAFPAPSPRVLRSASTRKWKSSKDKPTASETSRTTDFALRYWVLEIGQGHFAPH